MRPRHILSRAKLEHSMEELKLRHKKEMEEQRASHKTIVKALQDDGAQLKQKYEKQLATEQKSHQAVLMATRTEYQQTLHVQSTQWEKKIQEHVEALQAERRSHFSTKAELNKAQSELKILRSSAAKTDRASTMAKQIIQFEKIEECRHCRSPFWDQWLSKDGADIIARCADCKCRHYP